MTPISKYVTLEQALNTSHKEIDNAIVKTLRYGRVVSPEVILSNLKIAAQLLDVLIDKFGAGQISSGYRCPALNVKVNGATNSAHTVGLAFDWQPPVKIKEAMQFAIDELLPFDRLIVEERGPVRWLHVQAPTGQMDPARALYDSPRAGLYTALTVGRVASLQV